MLDEFQELTKFGTEFLKYLRGTITAHKKVNYIIAGSNVSLMENLLNKKNSPFYNLFLIKNLGNLPKGEAKLFLEKKFKGFTFTPEALEEIIELTQGHPFYLQWLARAIFIRAIDTKKFNREDVKKAFKEAMNETSGHFKYELSKIESKGKYMDILTVMAKHDAATPSVIGKYLDMEAGSVAPYLKRLIEYGYLEKSNGEYGFRDFILKEWIKIRYEF